jgi:hypothetical protein
MQKTNASSDPSVRLYPYVQTSAATAATPIFAPRTFSFDIHGNPLKEIYLIQIRTAYIPAAFSLGLAHAVSASA